MIRSQQGCFLWNNNDVFNKGQKDFKHFLVFADREGLAFICLYRELQFPWRYFARKFCLVLCKIDHSK